MKELKSIIESLRTLNVSEKTEKKNGLTYLSWAWAWDEVLKKSPTAKYEVIKNDQGLPYFYDQKTGYMVFTKVTIDELTHEMWLPVMDSTNKAMKAEPYTVKTKYKELTVSAATMFDINKTIMRCLVKNLAMFGLGLYIYAGEDLPEIEEEAPPQQTEKPTLNPPQQTKKDTPKPIETEAQKKARFLTTTVNAITHNGLTIDQKNLLAEVILWLPKEERKPWLGVINNWGKDGASEMVAEINGLKLMQASERRNKLNELQSNQIPF